MKKINKDILKLAVPSILANITVPLVGMVDVAIAGHLDSQAATLIGGIAVGSMLFDLLYWNFAFLRVGTGGLTAQAFGRSDNKECSRILVRALGISLACALLLILIQWIFVRAAFLVIDCTPQVRELASDYFFVRIWAAPATLSLLAFKGWFIGMQDSVSPMVTDIIINLVNIFASFALALGIETQTMTVVQPIGFKGVALGTVIAQYIGLVTALLILIFKYSRKTLVHLTRTELADIFSSSQTRRFFVMNADLFVRSLCFIAIYIGFTTISAGYSDTVLAVGSILMKLLMIFSYFTDGFAYAAEALTGRYIGAKNEAMTKTTIKWTFVWSMGIAAAFVIIYQVAGVPLLKMMTSDQTVVQACEPYLPWLLLMPIVGCAAFTWDGIYIGATATSKMRNSMLWAVVGFVVVWFAGISLCDLLVENNTVAPERYNGIALHILMAAYFAHLLVRTVYLTCLAPDVIGKSHQG